ncbi:MAG: hypothetical protein KGJ55_08095 [Gammaproteobacteria bacterium]|nr:hypothetical protein [Gammaproteobacteria bacterium]
MRFAGEPIVLIRPQNGTVYALEDRCAREIHARPAQGRTQPDRSRLMMIRTGYPYRTLQLRTAGSTGPALDLWNIYVPVDHQQCINQTYGLMMVRKPEIPGMTHLLWPFIVMFTNGIFSQDQDIVEAGQRAFDDQGEDRNNEIFPIISKRKDLLTRKGVPPQA